MRNSMQCALYNRCLLPIYFIPQRWKVPWYDYVSEARKITELVNVQIRKFNFFYEGKEYVMSNINAVRYTLHGIWIAQIHLFNTSSLAHNDEKISKYLILQRLDITNHSAWQISFFQRNVSIIWSLGFLIGIQEFLQCAGYANHVPVPLSHCKSRKESM